MKIGILGTRGIPNAYGGFEQFAEHLAVGLVKKNHEVFVYNSSDHPCKAEQWNGVTRLVCKDWERKIGTAGQFIYDYNCLRDARKRGFDILLQLGYTSNSIWYWLWPKKPLNVVNMDGLEWKRSKYQKSTQRFLRVAEQLAANHADVLISDSIGIQEYLMSTYKKISHFIPYGADIPTRVNEAALDTWNLRPFEYYLVVARMEPENNIKMIIEGFLRSDSVHPLIIVGNYGNKYGQYLKKEFGDPRVRFVGPLYDKDLLNALRSFARTYFHGHSVGGTNPSLLEAMACGSNIAAHANIFNRAIIEDAGSYFSSEQQVQSIVEAAFNVDMVNQRKERNLEKIRMIYNWDIIINKYEKVFLQGGRRD